MTTVKEYSQMSKEQLLEVIDQKNKTINSLNGKVYYNTKQKDNYKEKYHKLRIRFNNYMNRKIEQVAEMAKQINKDECVEFKLKQRLEKIKKLCESDLFWIRTNEAKGVKNHILKIIEEQ